MNNSMREGFKTIEHTVDFCVIGGGISGMLAAISAARHGARVLLMQDRPVLGGNASSEIRMWIRGAHGENLRETGILEEIALENIYRNPTLNFSVWDSILYEKVRFQDGIELLLNCSCNEAEIQDGKIASVTGWQTTTQTFHKVSAKIFADCSGDSVLAPLTGAKWRMGREERTEFGEDIAPETADSCTMGQSCLLQVRETDKPVPYIPPQWANKYTADSFPYRLNVDNPLSWQHSNFWWMELGGVYDSIGDTETLRDELLKVVFGVWDFIKNGGQHQADNWELDWVGFLPGKRESRRYVGKYILNQNDIRAEGKFDDIVAYGGWSMDDHHPAGIATAEKPTIYHAAPSPYGIPYRCLYSENIENLMFAGRNISATHTAMSSTRVMATCGMLGQAIGTAAAIAIQEKLTPHGVYEERLHELQQTLMADDCYLPWRNRDISELLKNAEITAEYGDTAHLISGIDRPVGDAENVWTAPLGTAIVLDFKGIKEIAALRLILDSDLNRQTWAEDIPSAYKDFPMRCNVFRNDVHIRMPETLVKQFSIEVDFGDGKWAEIFAEANNRRRLVHMQLKVRACRIRIVPLATWGADCARVFGIDVR